MSSTVTVGDELAVQWNSDGEEYFVHVLEVLCADSNKLKCSLKFQDEIDGDNPRVVKLHNHEKVKWRKLEPSSANADEPPAKKQKTTPKNDQTDHTTGMSKIELLERQIKLIELIMGLMNNDIEWPTIMSDLLSQGYSNQECSIFRDYSKKDLRRMLLSKQDLLGKKQEERNLLLSRKNKKKEQTRRKKEEKKRLLASEIVGKNNLSIYVIDCCADALF